ncbi:hypothetical protein DW725_04075 [Clostridiaceae bacterium AM27-36LB]|nr:hypothetical protein DWX14_05815 [Clostridiaceae bacterium AF18-31LB]RHT83928.1 hypothetical protein DW725_04075 [Clostridiaceae bacterium AM27-36LB]
MKKKGIITWIRKKKVRYAAAGTLCLAAAIGILVLGLGIDSRAESLALGTDPKINFETTTDGDGKTIYLIDSAEQISKLGQASEEQTREKIFRLNKDLEIGITSAATGTFAGTFDGNGHVIKINHLDITDSTPGTETQGVSQGALFGTVSGTVENLIIDVTDGEATYQRTSDAGVTESSEKGQEIQAAPQYSLADNEKVTVNSTGYQQKAYQAICFNDKDYTTVYLDTDGKECTKETAGADEYRKYVGNKIERTTTTNTASNASVTDSFGILCGTIGSGGTVKKVSLNGASVTVRQAGASHPEKVISDNKTPYAFYYKVEYMPVTVAHEMEVTKDNTLEIKIPEVEQKTSVTVGNQAVGELLSMEVTAPQAVASKDGSTYTITYNLKLAAVDETVSEAVLKTNLTGGTWSSNAANGKVSSITKSGTTVTYTYTGTVSALPQNISAKFWADVSDGTGQTVPVTPAALTTVIINEKVPDAVGTSLKLSVSAPTGKAMEAGETSPKTEFTVVLKNTTSRELSDAVLTYEDGMTVTNAAEGTVDPVNHTITFSTLLADEKKTVTISKADSNHGTANTVTISGTFLASAKDGNQRTAEAKATASTLVYTTVRQKSVSEEKKALWGNPGVSVEVSAPEMVYSPDSTAEITYTITVKNLHKSKAENISVVDGNNNNVIHTFSNVAANGTDICTLKKTVPAPTEASGIHQLNQKIKATATYSDGSSGSASAEKTASTTVYGTAGMEESVGSAAFSANGVQAQILTSTNAVTNRSDAKVSYTLKITPPASGTVTVTAPAGGSWTGNYKRNAGSTTSDGRRMEVVSSGSGVKTITITYSLKDVDASEYESVFSFAVVNNKVSTSCPDLTVTTALTNGSDKTVSANNEKISENQLQLEVKAPGKTVKDQADGSAELVYELTPTVADGITGTQLTSSVAGTWGTTEESAREATTTSTNYTVTTSDKKIYFIRKTGTGESKLAQTVFQIDGKKDRIVYTAATEKLQTTLVDLKPETVTKTPGNLEVEMKAMPSILTEGNSMVLTLTLKNVSDKVNIGDGDEKGNPIHISTDLKGWTVQPGSSWSESSYTVTDSATGNTTSYDSQNLEPKESVVLTKTITSTSRPADGTVQVVIKGYDIYAGTLPTYTYDEGKSKKQSGEPFTETEEQGTVKSAQNLVAGGLTGRNEGTIQEIRQNLTILQADRREMDNQPELKAGGIAGEVAADGKIENVYLTGAVKSSVDGAVTGLAAGSGTGSLTRVIAPAASSEGDLGSGLRVTDAKTGAEAKPENTWSNYWTAFSYYESTDITAQGRADDFNLKWLVNPGTAEGKDVFTFQKEAAGPRVQISFTDQKSGRTFEYYSIYQARKHLTDVENTVYESETNMLELGDSGYYRPVSVYATDGYFQYVQCYKTSEELPAAYYPYEEGNKKPVFIWEPADETEADTKSAWSVVRKNDKTLEDQIVLALNSNIQTSGLVICYGKDGALTATRVNRNVYFPFEGDAVQITAVPIKNGKIYEEEVSPSYNSANRERLPKPEVFSAGYYDKKGDAVEQPFQSGGTYETEEEIFLRGQEINGCSYQYLISGEDVTSEWKKDDANVSWTKEETTLTGWATVLNGKMLLPDKAATGQYLYVKVQKEHYPDTVYCFGSLSLTEKAGITASMYYQYDQTAGKGDAIPEEGKILPGDILVVTANHQPEAMSRVQYLIKTTAYKDTVLWEDTEWKDYIAPIQVSNDTNSAACYVYMRLSNAEGTVYSAIESQEYIFGRVASYPYTSPRTVYNQPDSEANENAATELQSGTQVTIGGRESGTTTFYLTGTSAKNVEITAQRVTEPHENEKGYYQIGKRWYHIVPKESGELKEYTESTKIKFYNNEEEKNTTWYIGVVSVGENASPSVMTTYIYKVKPSEPVAVPEASLPTKYSPGGETAEIAVVEKGSYISFRSLTSGAELLYKTNDNNVAEKPEENGTLLYDNSTGIRVDGNYGDTFQVNIRAVKWDEEYKVKEMKSTDVYCFTYMIAEQKQALKPTATPVTQEKNPTVVTPGDKILLSTTTDGADIYYTVDGSSPEITKAEDGKITNGENTRLYNPAEGIVMPLDGEGYFTVHAIAVAAEYKNSPEAIFIYAYPDSVQSPYANIPSGSVDLGTKVLLKNKTDGATIHYTVNTDGSVPADPTVSSSVFDEAQPIVINGKTVIKAFAVKNGVKSAIVTLTYTTKDQLASPTASIESGAMVSRGTRLKLKAASGATIYYTTDGSDPTDRSSSSVVSGSDLVLDGAAGAQVTVKAYAVMDGKSASEVATFTYQISKNMGGVTADVATGSEVSNGSKVNLMTDVTDAQIYYTTDGSSPADSGIKGTVVTINGTPGSTFTIKAVAKINGDAGTVCTFTYRIKERPSAPTASPSGGELTIAKRVELSSSAEKIYYTTDGTTPTESSNLYKEPVLINRTTNLKAIAVSKDGEISEVASFQYTAAQRADMPKASYESGSALEPGTVVTLRTDTANAQIYYSTDGTDPTLDTLDMLLKYTEEGIIVSRTVTVKAVAYREDLQLSKVGTFQYLVDTIPAVEAKKEAEAQAEAEALHDTDVSGLARKDDFDETAYEDRILRENECGTVVSGTEASLDENTVLITEAEACSDTAAKNVKKLFGEDYKILASYDMYLMKGGSKVQPAGQVEIGIPIPAEYENAAVTIIYIDNNDKITRQETRRKDGMAYAYTDHFSNYALVGLEDPESGQFQIPWLMLLEILAGACVLGGIIYFIRKTTRTSNERK